ncbi:MAG TPA: hypothetical protein ENI27_08930, partial [bacterium]|nr:hypothetical protein [bacterium]
MMETFLRKWDGECTIVKFDRPTGAWIFIAIHSTRLGPATGGTRMMFYPDPKAALQDALRLAAGMTYKFAVPGFPRGGGKAVVAIPPDLKTNSRVNLPSSQRSVSKNVLAHSLHPREHTERCRWSRPTCSSLRRGAAENIRCASFCNYVHVFRRGAHIRACIV